MVANAVPGLRLSCGFKVVNRKFDINTILEARLGLSLGVGSRSGERACT